ncbi:DHHW family protein [Anaerobacillus sp. CMMVII]|uniref:DHHW family protein n=1 Tax=Anaerobacillus sp. CMMVII TaxID=2755588 RepID=UPI0021B80C2A|nr:DHHW family protein [Anaerobacillus sp. CMMVII]
MLPMYAETYSQKETLENIEKELADTLVYLDVYESLNRKKDDSIYFRTDHHWTMRGAFYAYETAAKALAVTPFRSEDFHHTIVSDNFYGTYHSKAKPRRITPDTIEVFEPKFEISYRVEYEGGQSITDTLFEWNFLNRKDQYALFLNGNHSHVKITSSIQNGRKLAVMKDSYAHAFLPFLANHFEELHVIDLRYYRLSIDTYLSEHDISEVLFLYNIANFTNDSNLIWLQR